VPYFSFRPGAAARLSRSAGGLPRALRVPPGRRDGSGRPAGRQGVQPGMSSSDLAGQGPPGGQLASHDTDGVILVTSELTRSKLKQLHSGGIPLVVADPANPPPPELASVGATNWAGGLAATEHLLGLGHRRVAAIAGPEDYLCSRARVDGYLSALERGGIRFDRALVRHGDFSTRAGSSAPGSCWTWLIARPSSSRAVTSSPWAFTRPHGSVGCGYRRISAWSGSTISRCPLGLAADHDSPAAGRDGPGRRADARRADRRRAAAKQAAAPVDRADQAGIHGASQVRPVSRLPSFRQGPPSDQ
jgi:hypothetical protein